MNSERWVSFDECWPPASPALDDPSIRTTDRVLVTNNLGARDRMGRMSHVWLAAPIKCDSGEVVAYTDSNREVSSLTHWKDVGLGATP